MTTQTQLVPVPFRHRAGVWVLAVSTSLFFCAILSFFTLTAVPIAAAAFLMCLYFFVWRRRQITGACPHCGHEGTVRRVVRHFDCASCHQAIAVKRMQFRAMKVKKGR
ncbi:MAG: hypothetical protein ACRD9L_00645 [Bryobacteraceae bacterium]